MKRYSAKSRESGWQMPNRQRLVAFGFAGALVDCYASWYQSLFSVFNRKIPFIAPVW